MYLLRHPGDLLFECRQMWLASQLRWHLVTKRRICKITVRIGRKRLVMRNTLTDPKEALMCAIWDIDNQNVPLKDLEKFLPDQV